MQLRAADFGWPFHRKFHLGSKDPDNRALGPKYYNVSGIWDLKPYYLGPWTL